MNSATTLSTRGQQFWQDPLPSKEVVPHPGHYIHEDRPEEVAEVNETCEVVGTHLEQRISCLSLRSF